jgi:peptidoglycan/xylan/chitin deacetylase (PgdA/CDA1 family)
VVLNLHNVAPATGRFIRPIPPEVFDELVGWLKRECQLTTFAELSELSEEDDRPGAILSFDDGYRDFVEYAMPILEHHGVPANQNVVPSSVETGRPPWNVDLLHALEGVPPERLSSLEPRFGDLPRLESAVDDAVLMRWGVQVSRRLKLRARSEREPLVTELTEALGSETGGRSAAMMTTRDIAEAAEHHEIGVHSYDHDSMEFETDEFFTGDLHRCRAWYRERVGAEPRIYAFPNGSYKPSQVELARQAGFDHVLLVGERPSRIASHVHPRITADGVTLRELRMRVARAC